MYTQDNKNLENFFRTNSTDSLTDRLSLLKESINNELDLKIKQAEIEATISWVTLFMIYICKLQHSQWDWKYREISNTFTLEIPTKHINKVPDKEEFINLFSKFFKLKFTGTGSWNNKWFFDFTVKE